MLQTIMEFNKTTDSRNARNVLILYDEEKAFIGDSYIMINKLSSCKSYFTLSTIDINSRNKKHATVYGALLKNNPYIRKFSNLPWEDLDFTGYDMILCINRDEEQLLQLLKKRFDSQASPKIWTTAVYSMSAQMLNNLLGPVNTVFPSLTEIIDHAMKYAIRQPSQLYISKEEKEDGNRWLKDNGLKEHEHLYIILDSTSSKGKLLSMDVYYEILQYLLNKEGIKILIFDEQNIGKENFYREWLGVEKTARMIFAKKLGLRYDLCILSSDYTKLVLGPCTGMMHCASGMYNHFVSNGTPAASVPHLITYTGEYTNDPAGAYRWWGNSPLVKCLIIRRAAGDAIETVVLNDLPPEERTAITGALLCDAYTPEQIISYLPVHREAMII